MIVKLQGLLVEKTAPWVVVDCHGIGYECEVPLSTFKHLPELGKTVNLLTHFVVREDAQLLYGFLSVDERSAFRHLLKVGGIGAKLALAILSGLSLVDLQQAVSAQDAARLTGISGIGKKTAERIILELKDKLSLNLSASPATRDDALVALLGLGYHEREARAALQNVSPSLNLPDRIRAALQLMVRK